MIEVQDLCVMGGQKALVQHVSLTVSPGEIVAVLGRSGAGKTELFDAIAGVAEPETGAVRIAGFDLLEQESAAKHRLSYLPAGSPLMPDMTVRANLKFSCDIEGLTHTEAAARIARAAQDAGIEPYIDKPASSLSKGLLRRAGFALAILHSPTALLIDEPTANLEPGEIVALRTLIADLRGERAILFATQSITEACRLADRIYVMDQGRVLCVCKADELSEAQIDTAVIRARIGATAEAVNQKLSPARVEASTEPGCVEAYFSEPQGADIRAQTFRALAASDLTVYEVAPVRKGLDELLAQLESDPFPQEARYDENA